MKKSTRKILRLISRLCLYGILAMAILVAAAGFFLEQAYPSAKLQSFLEKSFSDFLGRPLKIKQLEWSVMPHLVLRGSDVQLLDAEGKQMAFSPNVDMHIHYSSFLDKKVRISDMVFLQPEGTIRRGANGHIDLLKMIQTIREQMKERKKKRKKPAVIEFERFTIVDGNLNLVDETISQEPLPAKFLLNATGIITGKQNNQIFPFSLHASAPEGEETNTLKLKGHLGKEWEVAFDAPSFPIRFFKKHVPYIKNLEGPLKLSGEVEENDTILSLAFEDATTQSEITIKLPSISDPYFIFRSSWSLTGFDMAKVEEAFNLPPFSTGKAWGKGVMSGPLHQFKEYDLEGHVQLEIRDGILWDAPNVLRTLSKLNVRSLFEKTTETGEKGIAFDKITAQFQVQEGKLKFTKPALLENDTLQMAFTGVVDYKNDTIDGMFILHFLTVIDEVVKVIPGISTIVVGDKKSMVPVWVKVSGSRSNPDLDVLSSKTVSMSILGLAKRIFSLPAKLITKVASIGRKKPDKEYVVLLHGLARTERSMNKMEKYLSERNYDVINLHYPSREEPIENLANEWLHDALQTYILKKNRRVNFVTHSMGGILVRTYLQNHEIPNLGRIVMLSPPNQGSELAEKMKDNTLFQWLMGPAGQQLGTGRDSVPLQLQPINAEVGIIAGGRSHNLIFSSMIPGPDDGKVSVEETKLDEMKDFLVLPLDHTFIMKNQIVIEQSGIFLKTGKFNWKEK